MNSSSSTIELIGHCLAAQELADTELGELTRTLSFTNFDWQRFCHTASSYWLLPYLHYSLESRQLLELAPEQVTNELRAVRHLTNIRNQRIKRQLQEIIGVLNQNYIQPLLLKGSSYLLEPIDQIQQLRLTSDIDLLIDESSINDTITALTTAGYQYSNILTDGTDYHLDPMIKEGMPARLELHKQPLSTNAASAINSINAWENAVPVEQDNLHYFIFTPEFRLLHQFLHAQLQSNDHINQRLDLRQLLDFHLMRKKYSQTINWSFIENNFLNQHRQIWIDYVSMANTIFTQLDKPTVPDSIEQRLRTKKMLARLNNNNRKADLYHWFGRLARLPKRLTTPNWYKSKIKFLLNKR